MAISITRVPQAIRNLNRFRQIAAILWKYGFGDIISRLGIETVYIALRPVLDFLKRQAILNLALLYGCIFLAELSLFKWTTVEAGVTPMLILAGAATAGVFAVVAIYLVLTRHDYRFLERPLRYCLFLTLLAGGLIAGFASAAPEAWLGFSVAGGMLALAYLLYDVSSVLVEEYEEPVLRLRTEERIRLALEELGPTFIKFGQILATRPDLLPDSLIQELKKLQDDVPPFDSERAHDIVERELGIHMDEVFAYFEPKPIAAASIAQVHRAELRTGEKVVIKIQRPELRDRIATDLDILRVLATWAEERIPEIRRYGPTELVEEFNRSINKEIDFGREAQNIKRFGRNFEDDPDVYCLKVYDELSTDKVITMEFIDGVKMTTEDMSRIPDIDQKTVARNGIRVLLTQVFVHGFFHADPHPGNIFVLRDNVICLIDYGMMGSLDQEQIDDILIFLIAILTKNVDKMIRLFRRRELIGDDVDVRVLRSEVSDLIERYYGVDIKNIEVGTYLQNLFDVIVRHDIRLPTELLLVGKALSTVDGIARDIYPDLDPLQDIKPILLNIYFNRLKDPRFYTRDLVRTADELFHTLQRLPRELREVFNRLRRGELKIKIDDPNREQEAREGPRSMNRLASSILVGTTFFTSAYLLTHPRGPDVLGLTIVEWLSVGGFMLGGLFSLGILYGLIRSGGH